jgi:hypothetical protein
MTSALKVVFCLDGKGWGKKRGSKVSHMVLENQLGTLTPRLAASWVHELTGLDVPVRIAGAGGASYDWDALVGDIKEGFEAPNMKAFWESSFLSRTVASETIKNREVVVVEVSKFELYCNQD